MIVIVGPSGSGKTTIAKGLSEKGYRLSISYTTRKPRQGEMDGVHYHFITKDEFRSKIAEGFFLEWITLGTELYGTSKEDVAPDVVKIVEVGGLKQLKEKCDVLTIFVKAPDFARSARMKARGDSEDEIAKRKFIDGGIFTSEVESMAQIVFDNYEPLTTSKIDKLHETIQICQSVIAKYKTNPTFQI